MSTPILSPLPLSRLQPHELSQLIARTLKDVDAEEFSLSDGHGDQLYFTIAQNSALISKELGPGERFHSDSENHSS